MTIALTYLIALIGAVGFVLLGSPLPWLLGPLFACLVSALFGVTLKTVPIVSTLMRTVLGVAVGAAITPALFGQINTIIVTLAMMPLLVIAIGGVGYPLFRRGYGFDHATAFYAAMPGGLQDMLLFGEEAGGDVRALSLIHATRVLVVVTILPFVFAFMLGLSLDAPPGAPLSAVPVQELVIMVIAALAGWQIALRIGMFGASILGPLFLTAALSLSNVIHYRPPAEVIQAAQYFIGVTIGAKYSGITMREVRVDVGAGLIYSILILAVSSIFAFAVIKTGLLPVAEGLLSFSPGGQAEMAIIALVAGADAALVISHHLVRIVFIILSAPYISALVKRRDARR